MLHLLAVLINAEQIQQREFYPEPVQNTDRNVLKSRGFSTEVEFSLSVEFYSKARFQSLMSHCLQLRPLWWDI